MGFNDTMDIRGIAWAGYFFSPSGTIVTTRFVCAEPPEMEAEEYAPIISDVDADCPC